MESQTGLCQLVQKVFLDTMHKLETREWAPMHRISQASKKWPPTTQRSQCIPSEVIISHYKSIAAACQACHTCALQLKHTMQAYRHQRKRSIQSTQLAIKVMNL